jgi:tyrosinase
VHFAVSGTRASGGPVSPCDGPPCSTEPTYYSGYDTITQSVVVHRARRATLANGVALRPEVGHANIAALQDAYAKMQAIASTDNRSWIYWAGYHGFPRYLCWHHGRIDQSQFPYDLFLPWHRAYLVYWDHVTRDQNNDAILPWWDWTSDPSHQLGIPSAYSSPQVNGGASNPLASGPRPDMPDNPAGRTQRVPGDPADLPTPSQVQGLMGLTDFVDFSGQLQDIHDSVHGWIGGDVGVIATAAFDPVFWAHHCMIDRLWYLWQLANGVNNIPLSYLDRTLAPFSYTVRDVLDISRLGYSYVVASASAAGTA